MKAKWNGAPLQVYDGQMLVGEVEDHGRGNVVAFRFDDSDRVEIGIFPTRLDAMRAVAKASQERTGTDA
jgi:hypothetical protein